MFKKYIKYSKIFIICILISAFLLSFGYIVIMQQARLKNNVSTIDIIENEWNLKFDNKIIYAGQVTFNVINQGKAEHEVVILKTNLDAETLIFKSNGVEIDESASGQIVGEVKSIQSEKTGSVVVNLYSGKYLLFCNIPGHYKAGMVNMIKVLEIK